MNNSQLINQDSGDFEWYTPIEIVNAAREVMGSIDLDPASSELANLHIKAELIYTINDDGLSKNWVGNIWLNHPFERNKTPLWIARYDSEYKNGNIKQACNITFANTDTSWFQILAKYPQCFLCPRTHFYNPLHPNRRSANTKGSVVTYLGDNVDKFIEVFDGNLGKVKI